MNYEEGLKAPANYKEFGKFMINNKFLAKNIFLLKYKKSYAPTKIKKQKVSDEFVDVITYVLDTKKINYDLIKKLNDYEYDLFNELMIYSFLKPVLKYNPSLGRETVDDVVERFEILKGQLEANNTNRKVMKECVEVLGKLLKYGKITEEIYKEILEDIKM
jgi:hypothetical protein